MLALSNPTIDFSNLIIKGAIKNYAYDGQCESSRAEYIFNLISTSSKRNNIRSAVLKGLSNEQKDTWSLTHLFDLAKLYALQGDLEARSAIYDRFLNHPIDGSDWVGSSEILELDGLNGMFYIAEKFGKVLEQAPSDYWQDNSIIHSYQTDNPDINVMEELKKKARANKYIRLYLKSIEQTQCLREQNNPKRLDFTDIIDEIINSKPYLQPNRCMALTANELEIIAKRLMTEIDTAKKERLLYVFRKRKFPLDREYILALAKQRNNGNSRVTEFALDALALLKSGKIRAFALSKMSKSRSPEMFVQILISNFKKSDSKRLVEIAQAAKNEHKIEVLSYLYIKIFEQNRTRECKAPLEVLYNKSNCGVCRNSMVKVLWENNVLSQGLKEEIKYDSNPDTRRICR